ncbi:MAG: DUF4153 domain-containing protein [Bacteroidales bacterium]|nr:DUF4153 domain-containing protein [Bacteroidales bacterium]
MKEKITAWLSLLKKATRRSPVEVILAFFFSILGCMNYEADFPDTRHLLYWFPALFLFSYTLNQLTFQKRLRVFYYLSVFLLIPFIWIKAGIHSATYWVTQAMALLIYLISGWKKDNNTFAKQGIHFTGAVISAWLLSVVAWLLSLSIYFSISYIFEIWKDQENRFWTYSGYWIFMGMQPLLFLAFNQEHDRKTESGKTFNILLNYVLSPALLIYAVILYLYFIKIVILWSLPKGAVAYIVVSFTSATFILKGCQYFLNKHFYNWFYNHASIAVLPALVMYWVGSFYRIGQYGFTEPRVYLVVVGLILTFTALLFFSQRYGRYLYAACVAFVLLFIVTYIPGITAKNIEIISQKNRDNYPPKEEVTEIKKYKEIESIEPVSVDGFNSIAPVVSYSSGSGLWTTQQDSVFYLYSGSDSILFKERTDSLYIRQLAKAGLTLNDSVPESAYPKILQVETGSGLLVLRRIALYGQSVSYIEPAYFLERK